MPEDEALEPVLVFFFAWFGFSLAVFPLVATVDTHAFDGSLGGPTVLLISLVATVPAGMEFAFNDRNPRLVGKFLLAFVALYFLALVAQAGGYVALGLEETVAALEFGVLFATYAVSYGLVYRGGLDRLRAALGR